MRKLKHTRENYVYKTGSPLIKQYKQIDPLETDVNTGEILNLSLTPKLVETEPVNIQAHIQSFEEEQDIRNLIKRMEEGDETAKTGRSGDYMEESLPEDYHSLIKQAQLLNKKIAAYQAAQENKGAKEEHANIQRNEPIREEHSSDQ